MRNRFTHAVVIAAGMAGLASCTMSASGNPVPDQVNTSTEPSETSQASEEPPAGDELPSNGAPKVENPIDASHFEQNPCDSLTAAQATGLNLDAKGSRADTAFGNGCLWRNPDSGGSLVLGFLSKVKTGLSEVYRSNQKGEFEYFEPIDDLEGFPAAVWSPDSAKPTIDCSVNVGLNDQLTFQTRTELSRDNVGQKDPCEIAVLATGELVKTIKAAS